MSSAALARIARNIPTRTVASPPRFYAKSTPFLTPSKNQNVPPRQLGLLFLGSPGSGKGTQSARIQRDFHITAVTSGDLLRRNIASGTEIGKIAAERMGKGELVSDEVMISLINSELQKMRQDNWLLDGFPRTLKQALALDSSLQRNGHPLNLVINLVVPEEVILQRIMDRWVHIPSGRVYNLSYNPPRVPGRDDLTGEPLSKRDDDNPEIFRRRLEQHHLMTEPLLEYYDGQGILIELCGRTSDEIYPQVQLALRESFGLEPQQPSAGQTANFNWDDGRVMGSMA